MRSEWAITSCQGGGDLWTRGHHLDCVHYLIIGHPGIISGDLTGASCPPDLPPEFGRENRNQTKTVRRFCMPWRGRGLLRVYCTVLYSLYCHQSSSSIYLRPIHSLWNFSCSLEISQDEEGELGSVQIRGIKARHGLELFCLIIK